jgi:hypothetical protein
VETLAETFMKYLILIVIAVSCDSKPVQKDFFEGKIHYVISVTSKTDEIDKSYFTDAVGTYTDFYFKEGNYKQLYNADSLKEETYLASSNIAYIKPTYSDTLWERDCSKSVGAILKFTINKNKEKVMGIMCDELVTKYQNKTLTYYYNSDSVKINPKWFKNYNRNNKNFTSETMGSLFLKCKMEFKLSIVEMTATDIAHEKVDDNIFRISKKSIILKEQ